MVSIISNFQEGFPMISSEPHKYCTVLNVNMTQLRVPKCPCLKKSWLGGAFCGLELEQVPLKSSKMFNAVTEYIEGHQTCIESLVCLAILRFNPDKYYF